jgi:hypothetical protein
MRHASRFALLLLLGAVASCATPHAHDYRGLCADEDARPWHLATRLPAEMTTLRELADANSVYHQRGTDFPVESYFSLSTGDFMLCRTDQAPKDSCGGEWWQFQKVAEHWRVVRHDAWICVS